MVHLQALPGSPGYGGSLDRVLDAARRDAAALVEGGADAVMVENFNDVPFHRTRVPRITVSAMTAAVLAVRDVAGRTPVGVNVLRNDGRAALAIAFTAGCPFIRVNVLAGARVTDQGVIEGIAADLLRDRRALGAEAVQVWADVDVKHSRPLGSAGPDDLEREVEDLRDRALADAVIVSGSGTGKPTAIDKIARVREAAGAMPVIVGSGVTLASLAAMRPLASGVIVGTALKEDGRVSADRVRRFAERLRG